MAQQRSFATADDCGEAPALSRNRGVANRVDAAMDTVKPSGMPRVSASFRGVPQLLELSRRDNPMLLLGQPCQPLVTSSFFLHTDC